MGWNIDIKTDKAMSEKLIDEIITDLPQTISHGFGKQSWGWSLAADVRLRNPQELGLSGSFSLSGKIAELAAEAFARRLEKRGYTVDVGALS